MFSQPVFLKLSNELLGKNYFWFVRECIKCRKKAIKEYSEYLQQILKSYTLKRALKNRIDYRDAILIAFCKTFKQSIIFFEKNCL